jgi:hypothetical protein
MISVNMHPINNENVVLAKTEMSIPVEAVTQYFLAVYYNSFLFLRTTSMGTVLTAVCWKIL